MTIKFGLILGISTLTLFGTAQAGEVNETHAFAMGSAVTDSELSQMAGGASPISIATTNQTLNALNTGNTINADNLTTGGVSISANAFSGFAGVGNFVFNTGNNNNLQGSLSITIIAPGIP